MEINRKLIGMACIRHGVKRESLLPVGNKTRIEDGILIQEGVAQFNYNLPGNKSSFCVAVDFIGGDRK